MALPPAGSVTGTADPANSQHLMIVALSLNFMTMHGSSSKSGDFDLSTVIKQKRILVTVEVNEDKNSTEEQTKNF